MKKLIVIALVALALAGCNYGEKLSQMQGVENVKNVGRGYWEYTIDNGTVKCREHEKRSELTCWKQ